VATEQNPAQATARDPLKNKVIILNGFENQEIDMIMRSVKALYPPPRDLIFAKTTETSLQMKLADLIRDISEDHEYLKNNPPEAIRENRDRTPGGESEQQT
jgi:hypothetical protein